MQNYNKSFIYCILCSFFSFFPWHYIFYPPIKLMAEQENLSEFNRFLLNNRDFLIEKHAEYFSASPPATLHTLSTTALIDYIYDIFSFNKYRKDPKTHGKISVSLARNIHDFIRENKHREGDAFTSEMAIEALTYCIQHNDMFSVQYDVEKPHKNIPLPQREQPQLQQNPGPTINANIVEETKNINQAEVSKSSTKQEAKFVTKTISSKSLKSEDQIFVNITQLQAAIQNRHNAPSPSQPSEQPKAQPNQFDYHQRIKLSLNPQILKRNAKLAFLSFCKNQMELGGMQTFDRLQEEASTMTIGKLLVYAKAYGMMNGPITREYLMQRFRRVADGRRAIDFEQFFVLLSELQIVDPKLFDKLQLLDQHLPRRLKFVKYPFYTQDQRPRELVPCRNFINRLTGHSGKTHVQLKEEIAIRRQEQASAPRPPPKDPSPLKKLLTPRDLTTGRSRNFSVELSFIDKIVAPEQNDGKYLGQYQIQHLGRNMIDGPAGSALSLRRKDSIVRDIRKRIREIQHSQSGITKRGQHRYPLTHN